MAKNHPQKSVKKKKKRDQAIQGTIKCDVCCKVLSSKRSFKQHTMIHTGEKPYRCDVCCKAFRFKCSLQYHMAGHTGEKPFNCDFCDKSFRERRRFLKHQSIHSIEEHYKCDVCDEIFLTEEGLKIHTIIHTGEKPYKCDVCGKTFSSKRNLRKHVIIHENVIPVQCNVCGKAFNKKHHLSNHMKSHTREDKFYKYNCDVCSKTICHIDGLSVSLKTHSKAFICSVCDKHFTRHDDLCRHRLIHGVKNRHTCGACGKMFPTRIALQEHYSSEILYFCSICKNLYPSSHRVKIHMKIHKKGPRKIHSKTDPKNPKIFKCHVCSCVFYQEHYLRGHMRFHFKCVVCVKYFLMRADAQKHICTVESKNISEVESKCISAVESKCISAVHSKNISEVESKNISAVESTILGKFNSKNIHKDSELKQTCYVCKNTFYTVHNLKTHLKFHLRCDVCGKYFLIRDDLQRHACKVKLKNISEDLNVDDCKLPLTQFSQIENTAIKCEICGQVADNKDELMQHLMSSHGGVGSCCIDRFGNVVILGVGDVSDSELQRVKFFKCDICGVEFNWLENLENHKFWHKNYEMNACGICGRVFDIYREFQTHVKAHYLGFNFIVQK